MNFIKKHPYLVIIIAIVILGVWFMNHGTNTPSYQTSPAERADLNQEVSVTGNVEARSDVLLGFETTGKVTHVYAGVGQQVSAGSVIASIDPSTIQAQIAEAQAALHADQATLAKIKQGSTPQEISVAEQKVTNAETAVADAKNNASVKLSDAYTKADDAIHVKTDPIFYNPRSTTPTLSFSLPDQQLKTDIENTRLSLQQTFANWQPAILPTASATEMLATISDTSSRLLGVSTFLASVTHALSIVVPTTSLTQTIIDTYTTAVSTARTNVQTALSNLTASYEKLRTASSNLALARQELDVTKAGHTKDEIDAQAALVEKDQATIRRLEVTLSNTSLRAPFPGIITRQDAKVGQIAQVGTPLVGLISTSGFKITANIPEVDIANIKVGDTATITLDAYGDEQFSANVTKVDPAAVDIEGVPTYKTTLLFTQDDPRIKPGMTANVIILTDKRTNVIAIPARAVTHEGGTSYVRILSANNTVATTTVTTGLKSYDGRVEITSGLSGGERVIIFQNP